MRWRIFGGQALSDYAVFAVVIGISRNPEFIVSAKGLPGGVRDAGDRDQADDCENVSAGTGALLEDCSGERILRDVEQCEGGGNGGRNARQNVVADAVARRLCGVTKSRGYFFTAKLSDMVSGFTHDPASIFKNALLVVPKIGRRRAELVQLFLTLAG